MSVTKAELERRLAATERQRDRAEKKAAAANRENEALRREIRTMRVANYTLNRSLDPGIQRGYIRRYEAAHEALMLIAEIIRTTPANGLEPPAPKSLEPWRGPHWARQASSSQENP